MSNSEASGSERSPLLRSPTTSSTLTEGFGELDSTLNNATPISKARGLFMVAAIYIPIFVLTCNVSLMTTIQSPIAVELNAFAYVSWFTSAFLIAVTSITPLAGRLCQIFSPKNFLVVSIIVQSVGLMTTSLASTFWLFLVGRAVTGIGSAAATPVAFILVTAYTDKKKRGLFFGLINMGYTSGVALGAIIAGALEPFVGWRGVFWLQIPLSLSAALLAQFSIPPSPETPKTTKQNPEESMRQKLSRIDYLGVVTLISAVVPLLYSLSSPKVQYTPIIISFAMLLVFLAVEGKWALEPIVPLAILKSRGNLLTVLATFGLMTSRWCVLFYSPMYALAVRGWAPTSAGLMLLPTNAGFAIGGVLAGWLHIRRAGSFYVSCLVTYVLFAASMLCISQISTPDSNIYIYVTILFLNGFVTSALLTYSLTHVLHLTIPATHVIVIPLNAMFRGLSASFGSSVSGGLFLRTLRSTLESEFIKRGMSGEEVLVNRLLGMPSLVRSLVGAEKEVAILGYQTSLKTLFVAGSVLAIAMAVLQAGTGWNAPDASGDDTDVLSHRNSLSPVDSRDLSAP